MMDVVILGRNEINTDVEKLLKDEGFGAIITGDFTAADDSAITGAAKQAKGFAPVIITEPPSYEVPLICGEPVINLMDDSVEEKLRTLKTDDKIVILLDYPEETPAQISAQAIRLAKKLADAKKEVVFLSNVVKSGYEGGEEEFLAARNSGVTFIKYEEIVPFYDEEKDRFFIEVNDGVFSINIETGFVVSAVAGEVPHLKELLKKLRMYRKANGEASDVAFNDDRFFLYPALSSRFGIYYLNPAHFASGGKKEIRMAIQSIVSDIKAFSAEGYVPEIVRGLSYPEVDSGKCAFCYSCFRACPHGALEPDMEASAMKIIEALCQACGTCIAICPGEAIARKEDSPQSSRFVCGSSRNARCKIYLCENGAAAAFEKALPLLGEYGGQIDSECISCGGSVGFDILSGDAKNYDTLIIACCIEDACRHMNGEKRACKQTERAMVMFRKAGLAGKRAEVIKVSHVMKNVMRDKITGILKGDSIPEEEV